MPKYKESSKKPEARKFPFDIIYEPFPEMLQHVLAIFKLLPMHEYVKLET